MNGDDPERPGRVTARASGLIRLAVARIRGQVAGVAPGKSVAIVLAVALTLAILVVVSGLTLALVDGGLATHHDATVRVEPKAGSTHSSVDGVERPRLANATARTAEIRSTDGVDHATAVLVETVPVRTDGESATEPASYTRVLAVGVNPDAGSGVVAGLPIDALEADDDRGIVLSKTAADRLGVDAGETVFVARGTEQYPLTVIAIEPTTGNGDAPVALVDREALLSYAGATDDSLADRVLVWGDRSAAVDAAAAAYPEGSVETGGSAHPSELVEDGLALATSVVATVVAVVVCALFIATTAGMAVAEDRPRLAILAAIGFTSQSRLAVVATTILATVVAGSILGLALGFVGLYAVDAVARVTVGAESIVAVHPLLVPYTVGVALVAGLLAIPYPLAVAARTDVVASVKR